MSDRFERARAAIDALHAEDPSGEEPIYADRMSAALERLVPAPSEALALAVRAQHLCRWKTPRASYPEGKAGYLRWRTAQAKLHSETAREALLGAGYDEPFAARVGELIRKKSIATDAEAQALEDSACLVFVEHYLADFARDRDRAQLIDILRKTWRKMSVRAREAALALPLEAPIREVVGEAVRGE